MPRNTFEKRIEKLEQREDNLARRNTSALLLTQRIYWILADVEGGNPDSARAVLRLVDLAPDLLDWITRWFAAAGRTMEEIAAQAVPGDHGKVNGTKAPEGAYPLLNTRSKT